MNPQAGQTLSHYRLIEKIGEGGMGEVWKALDATLGREVAVKILPGAFAEDQERLARFEREAKTLAALNHPNIAVIHGLEESDGLRFLVMELVPGEDLAQRLSGGAIAVQETLALCRQISEALEAAHERGIIHRDLKPGNIRITPDGKVKVLDFGLAKALVAESVAGDPSLSPTITSTGTRDGVILGTAAYMSPEQARGKPVDKRTDIWSFGCVLYEMLTGKHLFKRETVSDTLAAVLRAEPDWEGLPPETPAAIRRLLRRCLAKDPGQRLQAAGDARIEIEDAPEDSGGPPIASRRPWLVAAAFALLAIVAIAVALRPRPIAPDAHLRLSITFPEEAPLTLWGSANQTTSSLAISPKGDRIVYVAAVGDTQRLFLRALDRFETVPLAGTEGAENVAFSPDGKWVLFEARRKLRKIAVSGGAPLDVCEIPGGSRGATWGDRDTIVFVPDLATGVWRVPATGGEPEPVTIPDADRDEISHRYPQVLPGGDHVIFTIKTATITSFDEAAIAVASLETGETKILVEGGFQARYVPPGHLIYARGGGLFAVPFDLKRLETTGTPQPVLDGVVTNDTAGFAHFDVSRTSTLVYVPGQSTGPEVTLAWIDREGVSNPLPVEPGNYQSPLLSPDGGRMVVTRMAANDDLWLHEIDRGIMTRLTSERGNEVVPVWSADGRRVFFSNDAKGQYSLYWMPSDGSGPPELLLEDSAPTFANSCSRDGKRILITRLAPGTGHDLWVLSLDGNSRPEPFLVSPYTEGWGAFSPNDGWIAYQSDESGRDEVYARPYPGPGGKIQLSLGGGRQPRWSRNGRELYYTTEDALMAVPIGWEPAFRAGRPRKLFETDMRFGVGYDPAPDGQRFLGVFIDPARSTLAYVHVIRGWQEVLRQDSP